MSTFQKATKIGSAPMAAAAAAITTTTTATFIGRPTTSRTTHGLANANAKHIHNLVQHYYSTNAPRGCTITTTAMNGRFSGSWKNVQVTTMKNKSIHTLLQRQLLYRPNRTVTRRNLTSAKPSIPKQKSASTVEGGTTIPPPPPSSSAKRVSFLEWYEGHLESKPVQTKMVTGSILWGLGDVVAQIVPQVFFDDDNDAATTTNAKDVTSSNELSSKAKAGKEFVYDYARTARAMIFGFGIHAPLSHVHFNFLEWMTIKGGFAGLSVPVFKAFMEQFVYWSWFSNSLYHGAMGAMQGMSTQQIYDRIADVLWETQKAQWVFWIPVQLLNFRFVPVRHQLNVVLLTSVVWTALLSAWYPPEEESKAIEDDANKKKKN